MGGAQSHFGSTDWDQADGGVKDATQTFDGAKPTESHALFTLIKNKSPVNQRDYIMSNEDDDMLYTTAAIQGTTKDFDLMTGGTTATKLFHIHTDPSDHAKWIIYSYKATFEGQTPATNTQNIKVEEPLFAKAVVTIAWDKYHGVISLYEAAPDNSTTEGTVSNDHLIRIEEIKSITPQFQSFLPAMGLLHPKLCGYWVREYTPKTDRTKMHLAKGTDIALHCILAVITNLLRLERQADSS